ncbi:uncharacterized protein TRIADDRAFT_58667 [Trichoplax adhaerens]|uniref:Rhodanese domain-containing protein n=1 Tax=Trichoplax adhaerens TaxID=10228 RepID=B3S3C3_TRIAD|nr:hypothetical protein TRIADDRAFT_58667 [Trichoplax adhaerens]EDV22943.1 hypothetical protein TRIADDRAFT_58667 [Trichoplax adhaerens]|eukprot:XP_002114809.1 hypothetical protein TRIADDRAFT_58667 [Trichoplax adhaerens]
MAEKGLILKSMSVEEVAQAARLRNGNILIVDCRPFLSYNTCHIKTSINIYYNHIMSRRKNNCKISVYDFVQCSRKRDKLLNGHYNSVVFYDQSNDDIDSIPAEDALYRVLNLFVKERIGKEFFVMKGVYNMRITLDGRIKRL